VELPVIGPAEETMDWLVEFATRWLHHDKTPPLTRLAFGADLVFPVDDQQSGYKALNGLLRDVRIDPDIVSDFSYQVNKPRVSPTTGIKMNRLMRWSVLSARIAGIRISGDEVESTVGEPAYACLLTLDINTSPDFDSELTKDGAVGVFTELVTLGKEIMTQGDIQ